MLYAGIRHLRRAEWHGTLGAALHPNISDAAGSDFRRFAVFAATTNPRPRLHHRPSLFQRVAAAIRLLDRIPDDVGERCLGNLARERRALAAPVAE